MFHLCSMSELASGIVSTALQCGTGRCPTDDLQLDTPVRITIEPALRHCQGSYKLKPVIVLAGNII